MNIPTMGGRREPKFMDCDLLNQHLQGVIAHGRGIMAAITNDSQCTGADLTITTIMEMLESLKTGPPEV